LNQFNHLGSSFVVRNGVGLQNRNAHTNGSFAV
jgi:hypothetical protein